jgi:hypothetical protein
MPEAPAARAPAATAPGSPSGLVSFFPVSERKLLVLSLLTLGLYQFYWFYQHWQTEKQREHPRIMPAWRSILVYFFCYSLFQRINERAAAQRLGSVPAGWLALGWILTSLMGELPPPYAFAIFLTVFFLLPVQRLANAVNEREAPGHDPNDRFTLWNLLWVVVTLAMAVFVWHTLRTLAAQLEL